MSESRKDPFFRPTIDASIQRSLEDCRKLERYTGSMSTYVESICLKYVDWVRANHGKAPLRAEFAGFTEKKRKNERAA